ncbi:MAG: N-acetylglutaminylglutamine synthetase [Gammaproteobacteria bacterium]
MHDKVSLYCGWGRIIFAQTYTDPGEVAREMLNERPGQRDIAAYVLNPQVVLSYAPQQLFLDPSDMLRLDLADFAPGNGTQGSIAIRRLRHETEAEALNDLYLKRDMVPSDANFIWRQRDSDQLVYLVAVDEQSGIVIGTVTGIDHAAVFDDPENGSSLWCLAVDPGAMVPGIGEALVRALAGHFKAAGRAFMDLSVIHDNRQAKALYDKLGFRTVQVFALKTKNAWNETLFIGPEPEEKLNPYARIIIDEARTRGIAVDVLDETEGYFRLSLGGKSIVCRESLSELTTAIAMSRCQDKYVTHRWLSKGGLRTPAFQLAGSVEDNAAFLAEHGAIVVKPAIGEQGKGITVGVEDAAALARAIELAGHFSERVLLESCHPGQDLRVVVINGRVVAAAVRKPAQIRGDGSHDARTLIEKQSRRRAAATGGESSIPLDAETERCLAASGYSFESVIPEGEHVEVRKTANLHTGGTINDVTSILHPRLVEAAVRAARRLDIPVVGLDFMVRAPDQPDYVIIEANERVGLANHEPQPTAERFIDLLFPLSARPVHRDAVYARASDAVRDDGRRAL